jgi:hypothetical protein
LTNAKKVFQKRGAAPAKTCAHLHVRLHAGQTLSRR